MGAMVKTNAHLRPKLRVYAAAPFFKELYMKLKLGWRGFAPINVIIACLWTFLAAGCVQPDGANLDHTNSQESPPVSPNRQLKRIEIATPPDSTVIPMGEDHPELTGLTVRKLYDDDSAEITGDFTAVVGGDIFRTGTRTVTITADGKTVNLEVTIGNTFTNTGLPVVYITTENGQAITSKENYVNSAVKIIDPADAGNNLNVENVSNAGVRGRGNTTWSYPKKPYRIKFNSKQQLFGLTKAKSWVLLANWLDPTLIMNTVTFQFGRLYSFPFTNHGFHVEVVLNGVYQGNYLLTEQVQVGEGRVDIDENEGFLVEMDSYYDEEPKFKTTNYQMPVMIKSPEDLTDPAGYNFVKTALNELDGKMHSNSFPESGYLDLIDSDILADFMILNELVGNDEQKHPKSTYMYREKGSNKKIKMGPLWDFDWAFGYAESGHTYFRNPQQRMFYPGYKGTETGRRFFCHFMDDPQFRAKYRERWNVNYNNIVTIWDFIDQAALSLNKSQSLNFRRWAAEYNYTVNYTEEITKMKAYLDQRMSYLNTEINKYESGAAQ
jgi:hypothetical protein